LYPAIVLSVLFSKFVRFILFTRTMRYRQFFNSIATLPGRNLINLTIGLVLVLVLLTNLWHARYNHPEGVIEWDIKSYYAWLPAAFIYKDLSLEFRRANIEKFGDLIWPIETPTGKHAIITTMGMAFLYSPFFFTAHLVAHVTPWEADGYSRPYRFALTFSALFYLWAGMFFLSRSLLTYFSRSITAFTLVAITLGTNLYYYSTYEAPMSHVFTFSLIAAFLWVTIRFYKNPSLKGIILAGLLSGLITLIRPVNIIILIIFFLWDIRSVTDLKERFLFFFRKYSWVFLMAIAFVLVWVPQFIYWHRVSGQMFYFSYGEAGGSFFFNNPQIFNILFSIKKGWLVYTPIMLFSFAGLVVLFRNRTGPALAISLFMIVNIYILSSWWNWWYGGGFGLRSFVDSYALLAIPFAACLDSAVRQKRRFIRFSVTGLMALLLFYNLFQTRQYVNNAIHWWWMNRAAYRETFLRLYPTERYWRLITFPDHDLARQGIYREVHQELAEPEEKSLWQKSPSDKELIAWIESNLKSSTFLVDSLVSVRQHNMADTAAILTREAVSRLESKGRDYYMKQWAVGLIIEEIEKSPQMIDYIKKKAGKNKVPFDTMLLRDAQWIYENQR
jgi:hypothetical protein